MVRKARRGSILQKSCGPGMGSEDHRTLLHFDGMSLAIEEANRLDALEL